MCTQLVHSLAHVDCGQSCGYPPAWSGHPAKLLATAAGKTGQKTTSDLQSTAHKACSKGSRGYPQPHTAQQCITFAALHKNRTIPCKPRGTKAAALCPRLVHSPIHAKRGQLWTTARRPPEAIAQPCAQVSRPCPAAPVHNPTHPPWVAVLHDFCRRAACPSYISHPASCSILRSVLHERRAAVRCGSQAE